MDLFAVDFSYVDDSLTVSCSSSLFSSLPPTVLTSISFGGKSVSLLLSSTVSSSDVVFSVVAFSVPFFCTGQVNPGRGWLVLSLFLLLLDFPLPFLIRSPAPRFFAFALIFFFPFVVPSFLLTYMYYYFLSSQTIQFLILAIEGCLKYRLISEQQSTHDL